ncbi:DMT family transporter [Tabrizicola sp.]|uniref:DMT family transporter n=1 Tax=Tabrizicola sp. TaxID=2005166 RepID=UPI002733012E|nr:DMT family transporter [Tabrizicola sp.]MDP3194564.1 DMT family transporter [Tabrizicola sp.]
MVGVALMLAAMAILPVIDVFAKKLGQAGLPILIVVWARALFGGLMTLPFALRAEGAQAFRPAQPLRQLARAVLLFGATFLFFQALKHLPIADALAIFFVNPLVIVILSALALREKVGPRRWAAVAVGFIGTLVIIRPGLVEVNPGTLYALGAGVALGSYFVMTRAMAGVADAMVLNFQTSAIGAALITLALPFLWISPTLQQWAMLAALGVIATLGHVLITKAYEHGEASLLAPLAFTEIIMATLLGWWFFGDLPDGWTVLGVTILIASAVYISVRERQVKA